ncbi:MAG: sulfotransferase family protein [Terriglobales bacterium]
MQQLTTASLPSGAETGQGLQPRPDPVFVVGMFRSGTSLLYALLNQHPQIALMYEGDLAHLQALFWIPRDTTRWLRRWEFWNTALARHKFDTSTIPDGIRDLRTAVYAVYTEYARQKKGATVWGCKSPTYHDEVTRLSRTFPNAHFIIIWRDLRHICRSILEAAETSPFFNRAGMTLRAIVGVQDLKSQFDALVKRGGRVHQLNYEDLVRDPEGHMKAICEFLEVTYDPRMSNLAGADRGAISDFRHHSLVKGEKIVETRNGREGLPQELEDKIGRYVTMWRKRYDGAWPAYPKSSEGDGKTPSLWERASDRVTYTFLQFTHHFAPVIFSFVPTAVWRRYRSYIAAKRLRRLLAKATPEKKDLIRKASQGNEQLLKDMGIDLDEILKKIP